MRKKKGIFGKIIIGVIVLAVIGAIFGGRDGEKTEAPVQEASRAVSDENTSLEATLKDSDFIGTWKASGLATGGNYYTLELLEEAGYSDFSNIYLSLYPDKHADLTSDGQTVSGKWESNSSGIIIENEQLDYKDGRLLLTQDGDTVYFDKISETAGVPSSKPQLSGSTSESPAPSVEAPAPVTTAPSDAQAEPEPAAEEPTKTEDSISPELKAFLDSYEACMDEYCAFMESYDASDLSQLAKYADLMSKYSDFAAKAEAWGEKDLNAAETAYYLEVMSRVSGKLLKVSSSI